MKILFPYVGDSVGGSHHSSLLLVKGLNDENDVEAIVALHHGAGPLSEYLEGNQIPFLIAPVAPIAGSEQIIKQIVKMFVAAFPLAMFLKKHSIDIVHVNDRRMHLTWLLAARVAGRKLVWHQRSAGPLCQGGWNLSC